MKLIIELRPDGGLKLDTEGNIPHTTAIGMIEHARILLRCDAVASHVKAQRPQPGYINVMENTREDRCIHLWRSSDILSTDKPIRCALAQNHGGMHQALGGNVEWYSEESYEKIDN